VNISNRYFRAYNNFVKNYVDSNRFLCVIQRNNFARGEVAWHFAASYLAIYRKVHQSEIQDMSNRRQCLHYSYMRLFCKLRNLRNNWEICRYVLQRKVRKRCHLNRICTEVFSSLSAHIISLQFLVLHFDGNPRVLF